MERVKFYFDPTSPWCYQVMRWTRRVEDLGEVELDWGVFSLDVANREHGSDPRDVNAAISGPVHRISMVIKDKFGSKEIGRFYAAFGRRWWEATEPPSPPIEQACRGALEDAGFDAAIYDEAMNDPATWDAVLAEQQSLVQSHGAFGVPTLVFDGGEGLAVFGPTLRVLPDDATAMEMWEHVSWLARNPEFFELKRTKPGEVLPTHGTERLIEAGELVDERKPIATNALVDLPAAAWRSEETLTHSANE